MAEHSAENDVPVIACPTHFASTLEVVSDGPNTWVLVCPKRGERYTYDGERLSVVPPGTGDVDD